MSNNTPTSDTRSPTPESASANEVLVKVQGISKKFCRDLKKSLWYGMKDVAGELFPFGKQKSKIQNLTPDLQPLTCDPNLRDGEFWANKDISFELRRGECLGLIGRNGAGKTTLLKMLNGLIKPDQGTIEMRGRVGALIALGAGFNPILSGRENIYVNGSILGLTKIEIDEKIEAIIDFAEIREFIDSPVQSYSSGMQVRLGFAVATALEPDVLILDEVLAVGDVRFRSKCYNIIAKMRPTTAIIFVSHHRGDLSRICDSGLFLSRGKSIGKTELNLALERYDAADSGNNADASDISTDGIQLKSIKLSSSEISLGQSVKVQATLALEKELSNAFFRISVMDAGDNCVAEWQSANHNWATDYAAGEHFICIDLDNIRLAHGTYDLNFILGAYGVADYLILRYKFVRIRVYHDSAGLSNYQL